MSTISTMSRSSTIVSEDIMEVGLVIVPDEAIEPNRNSENIFVKWLTCFCNIIEKVLVFQQYISPNVL